MSSTDLSVQRPARGPAFTYVTLMLALLMIFALFTFSPPPAALPAIAEVAPNAVKQITEAPQQQAVSPGGTVGSLPSKRGTPPPPVHHGSGAPLTPFHCIGNPPTQIEDPQSPPCVPTWQGNNGGSTWKGVTGDTINVVVPNENGQPSWLKAYQNFFNTRFQFYGRKLNLIGTSQDTPTTEDEATSQQVQAQKADEENHAFASLPNYWYQGTTYYKELARRHIISITDYAEYDQQQLDATQPFVWQYGMGLDGIMTMTGNWICHRLAGKLAAYTTDPLLLGQRRTFGLLYQDTPAAPMDISPLQRALNACGVSIFARHLPENVEQGANSTGSQYPTDPTVQDTVLAMKNKHVSSILCLCDTTVLGGAGTVATNQNYHPEWMVASYEHHEDTFVMLANDTDASQRTNTFGLSFMPKLQPFQNDPSVWALQEGDPTAFNPATNDTSIFRQLHFHQFIYRPLLLLASGIQMAGPNLTPYTFARGLQDTDFPNPSAPPIEAGKVGFNGGSYSMTIDAAEFWWSNSAAPPFKSDPNGTWCYVDSGERRTLGHWPGNPTYFQGPCDT